MKGHGFLPGLKSYILFLIIVTAIVGSAGSASAYFYPGSNVPPGPPPNYNQIDTTFFKGAPAIPLPPPDSGGYFIFWDQGKWNIVAHIYSLGNSLEQFHGSVLAIMDQQPELGVNVFIDEFELWGGKADLCCLEMNDRWGWVDWGDGLYEIWWDLTTKQYKEGEGDLNDIIRLSLVGCAVDFNLWSSDHGCAFGPDQVYLGADMIPLSEIPEFEDTYPGLFDPYQAQAGSDPLNDPNITIFTPKELPGASYNKNGLIKTSDVTPCFEGYGERFAGAFAYEGNGLEFSTICIPDQIEPPDVLLPNDTSLFWCLGAEYCFEAIGFDPDSGDTVTLALLEGPVQFPPVSAVDTVIDTICFIPDAAGQYRFVLQVEDQDGLTAVDTVLYTIELGSVPVLEDQQFFADLCGLGVSRELQIVYDGAAGPVTFELISGPGTIDPVTGLLVYSPDISGTYYFEVAVSNECGADTATITDEVALNLPPSCVMFDSVVYLCAPEEICFEVLSSDPENDEIIIKFLEGPGGFTQTSDSSGVACFMPADVDSAAYDFVFSTADSCVLAAGSGKDLCPPGCIDTVTITVLIGRPGTLACLDTTVELCVPPEELPDQVCVPGFFSTWATTTVSGALLKGDTLCFTPDSLGVYTFEIIGSDTCGLADTCMAQITLEGNNVPYVTMADDFSIGLCRPEAICFAATADDLDFDIVDIAVNLGYYDNNTNQVCFEADTSGIYIIVFSATDACGLTASDTTIVTVDLQQLPTVSLGDDTQVAGCDLSEICIDAVVTGDRIAYYSTSIGVYDTTTGQLCFTPPSTGSYEVILQVADDCDNVVADTVMIDVTDSSPPQISGLADSSLYICYPRQVCLEVDIADPDDDIADITVSRGSYSDGRICFVAYNEQLYEIILTVTDSCDHVAEDTAYVEVSTDQGATEVAIDCPLDTIFLCQPETLSFAITGEVPPDAELSVGGVGAYLEWIEGTPYINFFSDCCLENVLSVTVTTECGSYTSECVVNVQTNSKPLVVLPPDTTVILCSFDQICLPLGVYDLDNNVADVTVAGGVYDAYKGVVCFTPDSAGTYTIGATATDSCGLASGDVAVVTIQMTHPPEIVYEPVDTVYKQCAPEEICLPVDISDADGDIVDVSVEGGSYDAEAGVVCLLPAGSGTFCLQLTVTDACGLMASTEICVSVEVGDYVEIACPQPPLPVLMLCSADSIHLPLEIAGQGYLVNVNYGHWQDGELSFYADTSGTYLMTITADAQCNSDTCEMEVMVSIQEPLSIACPEDALEFLCGPDTLCYDFTFAPSSALVTASGGAYISDGQVCVPVLQAGTQVITLSVSTECGVSSCSFEVTSQFNSAPQASLGEDTTITACELSEVCLYAAVFDADGNLDVVSTSHGELVDDTLLCYTPTGFGLHEIVISATDECGLVASDTVVVEVVPVSPVAIQCPVDLLPLTICEPGDYCLPLSVTGESYTVSTSYGVFANDTLCFSLDTTGTYLITVIAEGPCNADTCVVTAYHLEPAVVSCGITDTSFVLCEGSSATVRVPVMVTGDALSLTVTPDEVVLGDGYAEVPVDGAGTIIVSVEASNSCSADTCSFDVTAVANTPPVVMAGNDTSLVLCEPEEICLGYDYDDAEGNIVEIRSSQGVVNDSIVCFTPGSFGEYEIIITVVDECGAEDRDTVFVSVVADESVAIECPSETIQMIRTVPDTVRIPLHIDPSGVPVVVSPFGYYNAAVESLVVYIPEGGSYEFEVIAQAECNTDTCVINLEIGEYISPQVVQCIDSADRAICLLSPDTLCLPIEIIGTDVQVSVEPIGTFYGNMVCLPIDTAGTYRLELIAYNDRDADTCHSTVVVGGGSPPVLVMPETHEVFYCEPAEFCFDVIIEDTEFDIVDIDVSYGYYDSLLSRICFVPDTDGVYPIVVTVSDSCGNIAEDTTIVTAAGNQPAIVNLGDDSSVFQCQPEEICVDVEITDEGDLVQVIANLGVYSAETGRVCFTPDSGGSYELIVTATDECGISGADTVVIDVEFNSAPEMSDLRDTSVYICYPTKICLPLVVTDLNNNVQTMDVSGGSYEDGGICFVAYSQGLYEIVVTAADECGLAVTDTAYIEVSTDEVAAEIGIDCPSDTIFVCQPETLCFAITGEIPQGAELSVGGIGAYLDWIEGSPFVCFFSDCCLENVLSVTVTTECRSYTTECTVNVQTNSRPLVVLPPDTTIIQCEFSEICLPLGISDLDDNIASVTVTGGAYDAYSGVVCFTPDSVRPYVIRAEVEDSCRLIGSDEIVVMVQLNRAPEIAYEPVDTVYKQCVPEEICWPVDISDADGNIADISVEGGRYDSATGAVCWQPSGGGHYCLQLTVTDACGLTASVEICVDVEVGDYVNIVCPELPYEVPVLCNPDSVCVPLEITGSGYEVSVDNGRWLDNELCFYADTSGTYYLTIIAEAQCNSDTCVVEVPVTILEPLSITCPGDVSEFLCAPDTLCYDFSFAPASALVTVSDNAYIDDGQVCVPVLQAGIETITLYVTNQCGLDSCSFDVTSLFNSAPQVSAGKDTSFTECDLHEICLPISVSDADGNLDVVTVSQGELSDDTLICFTPTAFGVHEIVISATDQCEAATADTVMVTYLLGDSAQIQCPDGTQFASICGPETVCILAPITPPDAEVTILPAGFYDPETGEVCVYVEEGGTKEITVLADAQCGSDSCTFYLEVDFGVPAQVDCPAQIDTLLCLAEPDTLCIPVTVVGTGVQVNVNPFGFYSAGVVCLPISEPGQYDIEVIAFGTCGADTCEMTVNVEADQVPQLLLPTGLSFERCPDDTDQICIPGISASDAEVDVTVTKTCGPGTFNAETGVLCFVPETFGPVEFCFEVTDGCHTVSDTMSVDITAKDDCDVCARLWIDGGICTPVGLRQQVAVKIETNDRIGGFDLLLSFDASALSWQNATLNGGAAEDWEYFTWNLGPGTCGTACPSGLVRFVGIADRNDGAHHPPDSAFSPDGVLLFIEFQVVNDQNLGGVFVPVSFVWYSCTDNSLSDPTGTLLLIDSRIYNAEGILFWDEFDDVNFPESERQFGLGAPDSCVAAGSKNQPLRCIEFTNGGVCIIAPEDIDDRGDVNLNGVAYEIADAVVFTNYFIRWLEAFTISIPGQIAATDINADGLTLTVADLSLLIRIIVGDANPIPKVIPYEREAEITTTVDQGTMTISTETVADLGVAYFVYDFDPGMSFGDPMTTEATAGFDVKCGVVGGQLRIIMYDIGTSVVSAGRNELIRLPVYGDGKVTLAGSELVDYQGRPYRSVAAGALPDDFSLMQNYPNPFNPATNISFTLPQPSSWSLRIYNIVGSLVWETSGNSEGGRVDVLWDGTTQSGDLAASGVYFYRLEAMNFSDAKKMILLK